MCLSRPFFPASCRDFFYLHSAECKPDGAWGSSEKV
nr:MAG TPA: hypothetical protein [Caudoviricetes sp.]